MCRRCVACDVAALLLRRSYHYSTTETVADQAYVTRYKCCSGWQHLPGELGCTYRQYYVYALQLFSCCGETARRGDVLRTKVTPYRLSNCHVAKCMSYFCPKLMSLTPLLKGSVVPTEVGLLLVHGSSFCRIPFLPGYQWQLNLG